MRSVAATRARTVAHHPRAEGGFSVPTVLLIVLVGFAMATAAVSASLSAERGVSRDKATKAGIAAAETGISHALLRYNSAGLSDATCLDGTGATVSPVGPYDWCPEVEGIGPDGTTYSYFARFAGVAGGELELVSVGRDSGMERRIRVVARSSASQSPFGDAAIVGLDGIEIGTNAEIAADVATNGDVTIDSLGDKRGLCGGAQVGIGREVKPPERQTCDGPATSGEVSMPPVNQGDVLTNNSNSNFFDLDPISGKRSDVTIGGANGRELVLGANSALTLTGSNYSLCKLTLASGASLMITAGATVNIYFDSPENCGYGDGAVQMDLASNARITVNSGAPSRVGLLFVGSETLTTHARMSSNTELDQACNQLFVIYAPRTTVSLASNSNFCGAIAGKSIIVEANSTVRASNAGEGFEMPSTHHHYVRETFVECIAALPSGSPDTGC
jgi:hypothetical protein